MMMNLNASAEQLEQAFREWAKLEPLAPRPQFIYAPAGPDRGLPRFGVAQVEGSNNVTIDPLFENVAAALVLREIVRGFFPPSCRVDIMDDFINHCCGAVLAISNPARVLPHDAPRWEALSKAHTRRYVVHYLGSPVIMALDFLPRGPARASLFHVFLHKLRQHAHLIPPDQATDIITVMIRSVAIVQWEHRYKPEDVGFCALLTDFMAHYAAFPTPERLAGKEPGWTLGRSRAAARRFAEDPVSPTYTPNPSMVGLGLCWVLLEAPPAASSYLVRHLTYLPFATISLSQCVGAPVPTYFNAYWLPPLQLDELADHLAELKQKGTLLDYQIFRAERSLDVINWSETLAVPSPAPVVSETRVELAPVPSAPAGLARSWIARQLLPRFGYRQLVPLVVTHLDPARNYQAFPPVIQDAALVSTANLGKDLVAVMPLLERYRNVEYVLRLLDLAIDLLLHLCELPAGENAGADDFGRLGWTWQHFPARDWLLGCFREAAGDAARQARLLEELRLAAHVLHFFAPFTIPPDVLPGDYLREQQRAIASVIKAELAQFPAGEGERLQYFKDLHDQIVNQRLVLPRVALSPLFHPSMEDFYLFARTSRSWEDLAADFTTQFGPQVPHCYIIQFRDQAGALVVAGIIRATHAQFRSFRRGLVGPKGVLGPGASLLVGRRVPFWDFFRRDFVETFDITTRSYAPIKEYLSLVRAEHLAGWARPRISPLPYARKVLAEPYLGPVERSTRPPPNVVHLTPRLVAGLKASFLSGTSALHNLVERRLLARENRDLNWPVYGLERYFLYVFLSTRQPRYIYTHLITPATRRVLASSAVSGFQTVLIEYLWPRGAPDDNFLRYLFSRTDKNVLAYSVHRVLSDTRFFNLDRVFATSGIGLPDAADLRVFLLARPQDSSPSLAAEFFYGGDTRHAPGSAGWELACYYFSDSTARGPKSVPPDSVPAFEIDPRTVAFSEKVALVFRGHFDALPLCHALPLGHYYRTEEFYHSTAERLVAQPGHVLLFDFPLLQVSHLDAVLDDLLRDPAVVAHSVASYLVEQNLAIVGGVALARTNPLLANPYDFAGGHYIHLPKRQMRDGKWHTLSLREQVELLNREWQKK